MVDITSFWIAFIIAGFAVLGFGVALSENIRDNCNATKSQIFLCFLSFAVGIYLTASGIGMGMSNTCPNCGEVVQTEFCTSCGAEVGLETVVPVCSECGAEYDTKFCGDCGAKMEAAEGASK